MYIQLIDYDNVVELLLPELI
ncbi:hypothetical protein MGSAQ_001460, partial [marine sediment metagenome]